MSDNHYPMLGGNLTSGCERLAKGLGAVAAVIVLYRGPHKEAEVGMSFTLGLRIDGAAFRRLTNEILNGTYTESIATVNKACVMLAKATDAEGVILFLIDKDGAVRVAVNQPMAKDFVAAFALGIANRYVAMN